MVQTTTNTRYVYDSGVRTLVHGYIWLNITFPSVQWKLELITVWKINLMAKPISTQI